MGKRGAKPKPTRIKIMNGTRDDRINKNEPMPKRARPVMPAWLDEVAKTKWRQLVPELDRLGLLTIVDGDTLACYCQAWAEFKDATETLQKEGRHVTNDFGVTKAHPAVASQRSAWRAIKDFSALYGFDPSSRSRLSAPGVSSSDPFEEFLNNGETG